MQCHAQGLGSPAALRRPFLQARRARLLAPRVSASASSSYSRDLSAKPRLIQHKNGAPWACAELPAREEGVFRLARGRPPRPVPSRPARHYLNPPRGLADAEAKAFYAFLSQVYDHIVNPGHWTVDMRTDALEPAQLDSPDLKVRTLGVEREGSGLCQRGLAYF